MDASSPPKTLLDLAPSLRTPGFRLVDAGELFQLLFTLVGSKTGLVATGTTQATALALSAGVNEITSVPPGGGVRLPPGLPGQQIIVNNHDDLDSLTIYASLPDKLVPLASSSAVATLAVAAGAAMLLVCMSKTAGSAEWKQIV